MLFGNNNPRSGMQKFPRVYSLTDFGVTADVVCQPSQYNLVGSVTVPAQQQVTFGVTETINGGATGAPVYLRFDNSSAVQLHGVVRFALSNATLTNEIVVMEQRTQRLSASTTGDRSIAVLLPEYGIKARQDSKLLIKFKPDGASSVTIDYDGTNTAGSIPVTVYQ